MAKQERLRVLTILELLSVDLDEDGLEVEARIVDLNFVEAGAWHLHAESALRVDES